MNMNRLRPPKDCDLPAWLSSVVWDATRDARSEGMPAREVAQLLEFIARDIRREEQG